MKQKARVLLHFLRFRFTPQYTPSRYRVAEITVKIGEYMNSSAKLIGNFRLCYSC